jgi:small subunit ribosomal protein S16
MAVKIRLKRLGNRNRPFYRITAVDERRKRDGAVIEELGFYNPIDKIETRQATIKLDRCAYWLSVGAQPSETVAGLLKKHGLKPVPGTKVEDQTLPPPVVETAAAGSVA